MMSEAQAAIALLIITPLTLSLIITTALYLKYKKKYLRYYDKYTNERMMRRAYRRELEITCDKLEEASGFINYLSNHPAGWVLVHPEALNNRDPEEIIRAWEEYQKSLG